MAALNRRSLLLLILLRRRLHGNRKQRRFWMRRIYMEREEKGEYHQLVRELRLFDHELFFKMFRMNPVKYEELLGWLAPRITRYNAKRKPITAGERLCVTLRFLVTGDSQATIGASYRMSTTTVGRIIKETCEIIWDIMLEKGYLHVPQNQTEWKAVACNFERRWNFPNCLGAIDGKHVAIQAPPRAGSLFFNYKKFNSIVLMAVVNANYEFIIVDIGDYGRLSDGSVFSSCNFGFAINNDQFDLPAPRKLGNSEKFFPYAFIGDEAFPLKVNLMKPYPRGSIQQAERVANYRFSRARRTVENAFGIATSRFRVFRRPIIANVDCAMGITKAVVALHNYLMKDVCLGNFSEYCPPDFIDNDFNGHIQHGNWRNNSDLPGGLISMSNVGSNNYGADAKAVRDDFRDYFNSPEGALSWQYDTVTVTENPFDKH